MGFFSGFAHKSAKKNIADLTNHFENIPSDERAYRFFSLWVTRGINLAEISGRMGAPPTVGGMNLPVYHYGRGAEAMLVECKNIYKKAGHESFAFAVEIHQMSNLAVSYPDEGYYRLILNLWSAARNGYDKREFEKLLPELEPEIKQAQTLINNAGVSLQSVIDDPSCITPHFLVPNHPLSVELMEREKFGRSII